MHRVGIIGLGVMGQRMMVAMAAHRDFHVAGVWDLDPNLIGTATSDHRGATAATSAESLIADPDLDLIYVATPPSAHVEYSRLAAEAKTAILCEKPLSVDLPEARAMVSDVQRSGIPNAVQFPFASDRTVKLLAEHLQSDGLGEALRLEMRFHFTAWPRLWQSGAGAWLSGREQGGFVREVVSHFVYLTHRLVGFMEIESRHVEFPADASQSETSVTAAFRADGVPTTLHGAVGGAAPDYNEWTLFGSRRSYRIQNWNQLSITDGDAWVAVEPEGDPGPPLSDQLDQISAMIDRRPHSLASFADGLAVQEVVEGLVTSDRSG